MRRTAPVRCLPTIPEHPPPEPPRYRAGDRVLVVIEGRACAATLLSCRQNGGEILLYARLSTGRMILLADDDARVVRRL